MKPVIPLIALALLVASSLTISACESRPAEGTEAPDPDWITLSDEGSLQEDWRGYRSEETPERWVYEDGVLHFDASLQDSGGDIITRETFEDFELSLEWRISECGNSGIFYRIMESDAYENTYHTGPEYQILDNSCHPDAGNGQDRTAAANYGLNAPSEDVTRPAGEWNEARIVVDSSRVEHWLNGTKVVEYELWTDEWRQAVDTTKFAEWADYGMAREGHVGLQDHGDSVWFRNIRIRRLE